MSDREKIKRLRIIVEQLAFNHNLDFKMLHASIIALLDMIDDFLKEEELTEEQQEIYDDLKSYYEASMADDPKYALSLALGDYGHNDNLNKNSDLLPALKKFLSEVE